MQVALHTPPSPTPSVRADLTHAEGLEMVSGFSTALGFPPVCAQSGGRIQDQHPLHGHRGSRGFRGSMSMVLCLVSHAGALELGCSQPFLQLSPISCFFFFPQLSSQLWPPSHPLLCSHQLLFHVCRTSVSWMPCLSACSSRKSNMYLMASGSALPRCTVLNSVSNKSSTNFCSVP